MNIALINASPKRSESASRALLSDFKGLLPGEHTVKSFTMNRPSIDEEEIKELCGCEAWIFFFPLYVDGIPSHLVSCLFQMEQLGIENKDIYVYGISNSGFYEGKQNRNALAILKNWCDKMGFVWGMGIGFGGGPALSSMKGIPLGKGPKSTLGSACRTLANAVLSHSTGDNLYISIDFPRFLYKVMGEMGWRQGFKANRGKR